MKYNKIRQQIQSLRDTIFNNPIEIFFIGLFTTLWFVSLYFPIDNFESIIIHAPIIFLIILILHARINNVAVRILYYISPLLILYFINIFDGCDTRFFVSIFVLQIILLLLYGGKENNKYLLNALNYFRAIIYSSFLALISSGLIFSLLISIQYLLDIWKDCEEIYAIPFILSFGFLFPILFLKFYFVTEVVETEKEPSFHHLVNYLLSPILIAYTGLLYIYIIKILVTQSLPKGMIAYMVISFVSILIILKGYQNLLHRRFYDWFYKYSSHISIAPLLLCWFGTYIRVNQYGFTAARIYLIIILTTLSIITLVFFFKKIRNYALASSITAVLLSIITYIPIISADDLSKRFESATNKIFPEIDAEKTITINSNKGYNIEGFKTFHFISFEDDQTSSYFYKIQNDSLYIMNKNKNITYNNSFSDIFATQLKNAGLKRNDTIPKTKEQDFLEIRTDSSLIILESLFVKRSGNGDFPTIIIPKCILVK